MSSKPDIDTFAWTTAGDGIDNLRHHVTPRPTPGPTDVLVQVSALSLNYRDLLVVNGVDGWRPPKAIVPISDACGLVVATGEDVTRFHVGDRILPTYLPKWRTGTLTEDVYVSPVGGPTNRGFLAGYALVDQDEAAHAPRNLNDEQAATLPIAGVTAWHATTRAGVAPDDTVLIHGTGGVALFALQIARAIGARVVITSSDRTKLDRAQRLGADIMIDYTSKDVGATVREVTAGRGADVIIETIGGSNLNISLDAARVGAHIAFIGLIGGLSAPTDSYRFVQKYVTIHGIESGSREMLERLAQFVDDFGIKPVLDTSFPVDDVKVALRALETGQHFGKIVLTV